jgi:hypothetical protein
MFGARFPEDQESVLPRVAKVLGVFREHVLEPVVSLADGTATAKFQPNNLIGSKACASLNGTKSCTMSSGVYATASLGLVRPVLKEDDPVR